MHSITELSVSQWDSYLDNKCLENNIIPFGWKSYAMSSILELLFISI